MSNCIWVDCEGGEYASVYRSHTRQARKVHTCDECPVPIQSGDIYESATGLWDGEWSTWRTCGRCLLVRADFFRGGVPHGMMADYFTEAHGFDYRDGIPAGFEPCGEAA